MAQRIVVIGGGISGLAAAWSAHESARAGALGVEVVLLEANSEIGGKARSVVRGEWQIEAGPTGYLDNEPVLDALVERAGIEKLPAAEASARRFLVRGGRLRELHAHPLRFAASRILSPGGLLRIAREPWVPRRQASSEESVFDFAERRLGRQAAERLIAPMVLGVFAGDARELSLPAAFPRMAELEATYGSLFRAMRQLAREKRLRGGPAGPAGTLTSFAGGLQELPRRLAERAPFSVHTGALVESLQAGEGAAPWRVLVAGEGEALPADAVILAGEAWSSARLLGGVAPAISEELGAIPCPGLDVVALGYGAEALRRTPRGFGALAPREEGLRILGVLWDTHLFPGRSPEGTILMRAMIGGATDPDAVQRTEEEQIAIARADLSRLLGLTQAPELAEVYRWPRAIPQYEVGHLARLQRIEGHLEALDRRIPGLHLAGNAQRGVAFGKAAAAGWDAGAQAVSTLLRGGAVTPTRSG